MSLKHSPLLGSVCFRTELSQIRVRVNPGLTKVNNKIPIDRIR